MPPQKRQHIPPNLDALLGEPDRTINGEPHWALSNVAAEIGCTRQAVANWINWGQVPAATYDLGRWWLPLQTVNYLRVHGIPARDTFPRLMARNVVKGYPPERKPRMKLAGN